jgi:hypothetical protein
VASVDDFRMIASGAPGMHCSYCPLRPDEYCLLVCVKNYQEIEAEREADGVIVNDQP